MSSRCSAYRVTVPYGTVTRPQRSGGPNGPQGDQHPSGDPCPARGGVRPPTRPLDQLRAFWQHLTSPALAPYERLFFEVYAQGLQGKQPATRLLEDAIQAWLTPITDLLAAQGVPIQEAQAEARLAIAVTRGLLLDLLATGDLDAVDAAMDRYTALSLHARPQLAARLTRGSGAS